MYCRMLCAVPDSCPLDDNNITTLPRGGRGDMALVREPLTATDAGLEIST